MEGEAAAVTMRRISAYAAIRRSSIDTSVWSEIAYLENVKKLQTKTRICFTAEDNWARAFPALASRAAAASILSK
jgi:hypothetical protein